MAGKIFSWIANDGSRNFAELPEIYPWEILREHLKDLPGAIEKDYISDGVTEFWLDFSYRGHSFSVNNQMNEFWFFVSDPNCPDDILLEVLEHFEKIDK